jgi:choline kinase
MSKSISRSEYSATYIGMTVFRRQVLRALFGEIGAMVAEGRVNDFFNAAVQRLIDRGLAFGFTSASGLPWAEIDDEADLLFARKSVAPLLPQSAAVSDLPEALAPAIA